MDPIVVLAQDISSSGGIVAIVGTLVTALVGALIWLVKHLVSVTIPAVIETHAKTISDLTVSWREELKTDRATTLALHGVTQADLKEQRHAISNLSQHVSAMAMLVRTMTGKPEPIPSYTPPKSE